MTDPRVLAAEGFGVFVYGTLKAGERNAHYRAQASERIEAVAQGALYDTGPFPIADLASSRLHRRVKASSRLSRDIDAAIRANRDDVAELAEPDFPLIQGEDLFFSRADSRALAMRDMLEDFSPDDKARSMYWRVLVAVRGGASGRIFWVWSYTAPRGSELVSQGRLLEGGRWPE